MSGGRPELCLTDLEEDLDLMDGLLDQVRILLDDHDGPDADACDYLRAWCAPEHDQAVAAMRRLRARLEPPEPPTINM